MHQDFKELLSVFNAGQVRYLIVGGYAVSLHAQPRATKDLGILIGADSENSKTVYAALSKFGAPIEGLSVKDFAEPDNFFRMGAPPVMVDIMPKITGVEFEEAWSRRVEVQIDDDLSVPFISRQDLLVAKLAAGRAQDLIDVDALRESRQTHAIDQQRTPSSPADRLGRPQIWEMLHARWQVVSQSGRAPLLASEEQAEYGFVYALFADVAADEDREQIAWARLRASEGLPNLSATMQDELRLVVQEARLTNWDIKNLNRLLQTKATETSLAKRPAPRVQAETGICFPTNTSRSEALKRLSTSAGYPVEEP